MISVLIVLAVWCLFSILLASPFLIRGWRRWQAERGNPPLRCLVGLHKWRDHWFRYEGRVGPKCVRCGKR